MLVGEKTTNEIPEALAILEEANLDAETVVTADAMHTQTKTAELIKKNAHYVFPVKGNQGNL